MSGELKRLIDEYEIRGVTSNPTIFEKAIDTSDDYSEQLREQAERQKSASEIFEALAVRDIQMAADLLAPVFEKTDGADGFVSLARYISDLTTPIYYIVGPPGNG
jgi:transaldolase